MKCIPTYTLQRKTIFKCVCVCVKNVFRHDTLRLYKYFRHSEPSSITFHHIKNEDWSQTSNKKKVAPLNLHSKGIFFFLFGGLAYAYVPNAQVMGWFGLDFFRIPDVW